MIGAGGVPRLVNLFAAVRARARWTHLRWTVFWVTTMVTLNSLVSQTRMSHENGIAARGHLRIVDDPKRPSNDFFVPGREYACRVRFGAATWKDDAKLVIRGAAVKFADTRFESPFDLMMNTGRLAIFWNARTFVGFMKATIAGRGKAWVPYLTKNPMAMVGGRNSLKRDPESVGSLEYNSKTCLGLIDNSTGDYYYVRYRLHPLSYEPDGDASETDREHPWFQNPLPDEPRNRNYIKDQMCERLDGDTIEFMLRLQARRKPPGPDPTWVTAEYEWDETETPWCDVAHIVLDEALDYRESQLTWFEMSNHPDSLPVPRGCSIDDPHSLNDLRVASIWARRARLFSYKLRGMPKAFGDSRRDPDWVGLPPMPDPPRSVTSRQRARGW